MNAAVHLFRVAAALAGIIASPSKLPAEPVTFRSPTIELTGHLLRPESDKPTPAVIALHGCGGLQRRDRLPLQARDRDWANRLLSAGYAVFFPDSFEARGIKQLCTVDNRPITPRDRADDAKAAITWLAAQPGIDGSRITVIGWSHGGSTVLQLVRPGFLDDAPKIKSAIAFYPGCRQILREQSWHPSVPLTVLVGAADDWTPAAPCEALAERTGFRLVSYAGAYHAFDTPNAPVRVRTGLGLVPGGAAHVGTDPKARAAAIAEVMGILAAP